MTQKSILEFHQIKNQGLGPYNLTNYKGLRGKNYFIVDQLLKRIFLREVIQNQYSENHAFDVYQHLKGFGEVASTVIDELSEIAHKMEY